MDPIGRTTSAAKNALTRCFVLHRDFSAGTDSLAFIIDGNPVKRREPKIESAHDTADTADTADNELFELPDGLKDLKGCKISKGPLLLTTGGLVNSRTTVS